MLHRCSDEVGRVERINGWDNEPAVCSAHTQLLIPATTVTDLVKSSAKDRGVEMVVAMVIMVDGPITCTWCTMDLISSDGGSHGF